MTSIHGVALATETEPLPPALLLARMGDVVRSSLFLSLEAALQVQEQRVRSGAVPVVWPTAARWLPRALAITSVATDLYAGYLVLRRRAARVPSLVRPRDWQLQHQRGAARLLDTAIALGGTLIKTGQIASVRGDLLPAAYVEQLATLQDRVPPHPWLVIEAAISRELGQPLEALFARLEPEPVAAASLAQVHRGWLRDGREVAVKVQYPEMDELVAADLAALGAIVRGLARLEPQLRLQPVLDHLRGTLPLELDFAHEAAAMTRLRAALAHRADVVIPEVIGELCTPRLLVMERVEGTKITDRDGLARAGIDAHAVARLLNDVYAEQMLERRLLHADPHPGNLLVQPGPRLVILDHGLSVELRPQLANALATMVRALVAGDLPALSTALVELGFPVGPQTDVASLPELAGVLMGSAEPDGASIGERLGQALGDVPLELLTVGRALTLLSGITRALDPDLDVLGIVAAHAATAPTPRGGGATLQRSLPI
jgi:predicted unusual protein kinase regulating ubiquinone biosynthesis (AarF/ABC1/UbiB family)